jgi:hypothetical protein
LKDETLGQLSEVQSDLNAITYLISAVYMGVGDLQAEAADPMRTLLDVVIERLNRAKVVLADVRKPKPDAALETT